MSLARFIHVLCLAVAVSGAASYPPPASTAAKRYVIDLDAPADKRWVQPVADHRTYLRIIVGVMRTLFESEAKDVVATLLPAIAVPAELAAEMQGIATTAGIAYEDVLMANYFYEITAVGNVTFGGPIARSCTSIVAQRTNGTVYFARPVAVPRNT